MEDAKRDLPKEKQVLQKFVLVVLISNKIIKMKHLYNFLILLDFPYNFFIYEQYFHSAILHL